MANILALDDNLELCKLIRTALERDGHRVETRQAGGELTEALCRWADCILLDVMMPGEDGFAVCRRIRSLTEAPILFLSARTDEAAVLEGLGIPPETAVLLLVRPVSGSGALAVGSQLMEQYGPDSYIGRVTAVMLGCSETTFYTVAVYYGAAGIRRTRHTVPAALAADAAAFIAAAWAVRVFFP